MKKIIISLGGSLIYPKQLDLKFLSDLKDILYKEDYRFVLYCGGGHLARKLQKYASFFRLSKTMLDWIGIYATRRNASTVKTILKDNMHKKIITDPTQRIEFNEKILIAAGWKPGWSTDYDSVLLAKNLGADTVINMSNTDYVYDKDPKKFKDAKPIEHIAWKDFRKIVGDEWQPGLNMPFDPIASKEAEKSKIKVMLIGNDLDNLKDLLHNKKFKGTIIS
ncbi:MAG: UMP kinase [Nanoarchaeota archaeon]